MRYKTAILIGRFQPFHLGHLYLIKKTLLIAEKIIIGIGSASIYDENNPLGYEERKSMIEKVIEHEKIGNKVLKIVPLEDFYDDKKWLENVKSKAGKFDLVVSNNYWTILIMKKAGYKIREFAYFKRSLYEGWRIRKLIRESKKWEDRVPKYIISKIKFLISKQYPNIKKQNSIFNHVILGGTFDHLHKGHKLLIDKAFELGKKVTIGLTTEIFNHDKIFKNAIQSYKERERELNKYLVNKDNFKVIPISEFTGGVDKNKTYDCILVSRLTYHNALKINLYRTKNRLKSLRIAIVKDELAEDGKIISSERIRTGEINRSGKIYSDYFKKTLVLPENLREELRKPLGKVFKNTSDLISFLKKIKPTILIAIGDIIVESLLRKGIDPDIKVIDFKSRRLPSNVILNSFQDLKISKQVRYNNLPGTVNFKTTERLRKLIGQGKGWMVIDGEEDLLTLPAILFAPLGMLVLYGHWLYGVIGVVVTEEIKEKIVVILKRFR